jgi:serine protease Do
MESNNSIVQVFVDISPFNWIEPYKKTSSHQGFGSGFLIDDKGHLITSFHVINEAENIQIQLPQIGKQQFEVSIIGVCPHRDIALLKLTDSAYNEIIQRIEKIPFLELGNSDQLKRSEKIVALGYPLGQESLKATEGIISGRQEILGDTFIQITAPLNPGNSGGPSLNEEKKVIGINTAIIPNAQNVGYIIPISDVAGIIEDLHKIKLLRNPILGCEMNYGTKDMVSYLKNPSPGGLYIAKIYKNTLFEKSGIQEGDMLYKINNYEIGLYGDIKVPWNEDVTSLFELISRFKIGEKITMEIYRQGVQKTVEFTFEPSNPLPIRIIFPQFEEFNYYQIAGMIVMPLTFNHISIFGNSNPSILDFSNRKKQETPRLIITAISSTSEIHKARILYQGDVIKEVNDQEITTIDSLKNALHLSKKFITIKTHDNKFFVLSKEVFKQEEERFKGQTT